MRRLIFSLCLLLSAPVFAAPLNIREIPTNWSVMVYPGGAGLSAYGGAVVVYGTSSTCPSGELDFDGGVTFEEIKLFSQYINMAKATASPMTVRYDPATCKIIYFKY